MLLGILEKLRLLTAMISRLFKTRSGPSGVSSHAHFQTVASHGSQIIATLAQFAIRHGGLALGPICSPGRSLVLRTGELHQLLTMSQLAAHRSGNLRSQPAQFLRQAGHSKMDMIGLLHQQAQLRFILNG